MRSFTSTIKNKQAFVLYLFQTVFVLIFGILLYDKLSQDYIRKDTFIPFINETLLQDRIGSYFFLVVNAYNSVLLNTAFKLGKENSIIFKEISGNMYSTFAYYAAKGTMELLFVVVPVLIVVYPVKKN